MQEQHYVGTIMYVHKMIASDKTLFINKKMFITFLLVYIIIRCWDPLEAPQRGASNTHPQHMFLRTNKKTSNGISLLSGAIHTMYLPLSHSEP